MTEEATSIVTTELREAVIFHGLSVGKTARFTPMRTRTKAAYLFEASPKQPREAPSPRFPVAIAALLLSSPSQAGFGRCGERTLSDLRQQLQVDPWAMRKCPSESRGASPNHFTRSHQLHRVSPTTTNRSLDAISTRFMTSKPTLSFHCNFFWSPKCFCSLNNQSAVQMPNWTAISIDPSPRRLASPAADGWGTKSGQETQTLFAIIRRNPHHRSSIAASFANLKASCCVVTNVCRPPAAQSPQPPPFPKLPWTNVLESESHIHTAYLSHAIKIPVPFSSGPLGVPGSCIGVGWGPFDRKKSPPRKKKTQNCVSIDESILPASANMVDINYAQVSVSRAAVKTSKPLDPNHPIPSMDAMHLRLHLTTPHLPHHIISPHPPQTDYFDSLCLNQGVCHFYTSIKCRPKRRGVFPESIFVRLSFSSYCIDANANSSS
ncbi:uncharacterized protein CLUP02_01209 [Colletotrichum lupini]|uniref:Uncharacterized protein n=1 Tax=Colletotrichum lupini TaxID=145971 RepID=A0A9Q8W8G2_9PEZI|nr:uncharacterized protein CLUP02_01209 [Colletotrichum lupini]UQC74558.1 hypothetical protein CLUP02_01209 [Colletotrichum lupini]